MQESPDAKAWDHDDHPEGPLEGEKNAKKLNTTLGTKSAKGESSSKQSVQGSKAPSSTHQQDFDAWVEVQEVDDDEVVSKEATPEFLAELKFLGKAKEPTTAESQRMKDLLDNMMKERRDIVEEYVYHLEQVKNYMENQIVWESREQKLIPQEPEKEALVFLSPQRNPNEPPRFLWNKDLFYLKNRKTEAKKYVLSLHKIHGTPFLEVDLKELLTRWVGIEAIEHDTIITGPFIGIVYENSKKERRVMNIHELQKFCDATLNRILKRIEKVLLAAIANHGF
ncbi:hypothetical protein Tco_1076774 [Tanacetum coccineum]